MPIATPGYTKNIIRRAFRQIIDKPPSVRETVDIWIFFASECAFCGKKVSRDNKDGHIDHLIPASKGGRNHVSNCVLACAQCNAQEKLDLPWEEFLALKVSDREQLESSRKKITDWQVKNLAGISEHFEELANVADGLADETWEFFELKIMQLKAWKQKSKN